MTSFPLYIYRTNKKDSNHIFNKFIVIQNKFDETTAYELEKSFKQKALVFSPLGNLWDTSGTKIFQNPIKSKEPEYYQTFWKSIDPNKYSKYNLKTEPNYFLSIESELYNGSGWILYRKKELDYKLLYNPMNREMQINDIELYSEYCSNIQYQDAGCYCEDYPPEHKCSYAIFKEGESQGRSLFIDTNMKDITAVNTLKNNCQCLQTDNICQNWKGYNKWKRKLSCKQDIDKLVICSAGLSADQQSTFNSNGIKIEQNCGNVPSPTNPPNEPTNEPTKPPTTKIVIVTVFGFIILLILLFYIYKK